MNSKIEMNTLKKCVILLSHSSYSDIWELTMSSYMKFFNEKDSFDFFISTDNITSENEKILNKYNFKAIIYDKNISWGKSLLSVIDFLKTKKYDLFLFSFDDLVLTKPTNGAVNDSLKFMISNNISYLKLKNSLSSLYRKKTKSDYYLIDSKNSYRGSLVFSILDSRFAKFIEEVKEINHFNAWDYEYKINEFIPNVLKCYSVEKSVIQSSNTIIKGKLDPFQIKISESLNDEKYKGNREVFSVFELTKFYFKTFLFRLSKYILPHDSFYYVRTIKKIINDFK